jgi:hypothetical protein
MVGVTTVDELAAFDGGNSWEDDEVAALELLKVIPVESNEDDTLASIELDIEEDVWPEGMPVKSVWKLEVVADFK